jgi:cytochrome c553
MITMESIMQTVKMVSIGAAVVALLSSGAVARADDSLRGLLKTCNQCHSEAAVTGNPEWPNLAGQKALYMANQLRAYREGVRDNPVMMPFARELSDQHIDALAAHYAALPAPDRPQQSEYEPGKHVSAYCIACHGMQGRTVNEEWPNIAGQGAAYIAQQLRAYRSGLRQALPMNTVAEGLSDQQIEDVATYYSRKQP